jgi:2-oxoglutarate ferredoxin oxidoreductase subunit beta
MNIVQKLKPDDYATDQEVRWCPGCGDYAILKAVRKVLADAGADPDNTAFISGIGCAARFPYYMETYGFHTIHGRAAAVATGAKHANPDLDIWVVSGDGDSLSIGGNHLMHLLRRDVDLVYLLFNNEIYGLTKGQASPTSRLGTVTPSSPRGSYDRPVHALTFALGAGARFVARSYDVAQPHLVATMSRAHAHRGTSFVEILQNCIVYNPDIFADVTDKKVAGNAQIHVEHGQPLLFGKDNEKGLVLDPKTLSLKAVTLGENGADLADILVHDETNRALAGLIAAMDGHALPMALGIIYCAADEAPAHPAPARLRGEPMAARLDAHLRKGHTWQVG